MKGTHWIHIRDSADFMVIYIDGESSYEGDNLNVAYLLAKISAELEQIEVTYDYIWDQYYYGETPEFLRYDDGCDEDIDDDDDYTNDDEYEDPFFPEIITKDMIEHVKYEED